MSSSPHEDELYIILSNALNANAEIRTNAENQLNKLALENIGLLLLNLSMKLSNEKVPKAIRQISSTIIKNMVNSPLYKPNWISLDKDCKTTIKQHVLSTLITTDNDIRKSTSLAIAGICRVDLPQKQWQDIFTLLINTSHNPTLSIQLSSIVTLTYIFEEITPGDITQTEIGNILNCFFSILSNESSDLLLIEYTLTAISTFTVFLSEIMEQDDKKVILFDLVKKYVMHSNDKIRQNAIRIYIEMFKYYYDSFNGYIVTVIDLCEVIMKKDSETNAILCYELWSDIGQIEINRLTKMTGSIKSKDYCEKAYEKILPILLNHLNTDDYENEDWTKAKASANLLAIFSQCCGQAYLEKVLEFVGMYISSDKGNEKHAALSTLSSILETSQKTKMLSIVIKSLDLICEQFSLQNNPDHIKEITGIILSRIGEFFGKRIWQQKDLYEKMLFTIINLLESQKRKVIVSLCHSLHYLINSIDNESGQSSSESNLLSQFMSNFLNKMMILAYVKGSYNSDDNVAISCFLVMGTLIEKSANDTSIIIQQFVKCLINTLENSFGKDAYATEEMRNNYQEYIISLLGSCFLHVSIEETDVVKTFNLIIQTFLQKGCIYEEGISTIGCIAKALQNNFIDHMETLSPYLFIGLKSVNEVELCQQSIQATSEIIQSLKEHYSKYSNDTLSIILQILSDQSIDQRLKLISFTIICDLFFFCPNEMMPFFTSIMQSIGIGMEAAKMVPQFNEEFEMAEYISLLRLHLMESISFIFTTMSNRNSTKDFLPYIQPIVLFIMKINNDDILPSDDLIKYCLGILGDICLEYGNDVKSWIQINIIQSMISRFECDITQFPIDDQKRRLGLIKWIKQVVLS